MEVKGQHRSNIVKNDLWLPNLEEPLMQVQGSNGIKYCKLCSMATKLGQKILTAMVSWWGLGPKACMHHFECFIN